MSVIVFCFCFCFVVCRDADGQVAVPIKKADVTEHPKAFDHAGLLFNDPPGTAKLIFI